MRRLHPRPLLLLPLSGKPQIRAETGNARLPRRIRRIHVQTFRTLVSRVRPLLTFGIELRRLRRFECAITEGRVYVDPLIDFLVF